jgi:membrane protease YdiL (CAAX protease family)
MFARKPSLAFAFALVAAGLGAGGLRTLALERGEVEHESPPRSLAALAKAPGSTRISARLAQVNLSAGQQAVFEVCAADPLPAAVWLGAMDFVVFRIDTPPELMLRVPLDAAHLSASRRRADRACLFLGSGPIPKSGSYSVDAVWPTRPPPAQTTQVALSARVMGRTPLQPLDGLWVSLAGLGALLALVVLLWGPPPQPEPGSAAPAPEPGTGGSGWLPWLGVGLGLGALIVGSNLPLYGPSLALVRGAGMALAQLGVAFGCARWLGRARAETNLGLDVAPAPLPGLLLAALSSVLLVASAKLSMALVPPTGEAPIQTFISWPSGMLGFALIGVMLPIAEEVFFRGYVYGAALRLGGPAAFAVTVLSFTALHVQQSWGNWGGLFAIFLTGCVLTGLRALTGSTLLGALSHLGYNLTLSLMSL